MALDSIKSFVERSSMRQEDNFDLYNAMGAPDNYTASDVAQKDKAASQLGMSYEMANAGWDDVQKEAQVKKAAEIPNANKWVAESPENSAFLKDDHDGLMTVYDGLVSSGILSEHDLDRSTAEDIASGGSNVGKALERARINQQMVDLGQAYLDGRISMEEARAAAEGYNKQLADLQSEDPLGFYGAVEQFYRMGASDLPHLLYRGLEGGLAGASAGAVAGSVVPGLGTIAGASSGALAGFGANIARGTFESAQKAESALEALNLLTERDDAGNYLNDDDTVKNFAHLYGMGSAAIETAGDAVALKILAPVFKTVGAAFSKPATDVAKDAIKLAMREKSFAPLWGRFATGVGLGALSEGAEEGTQEALGQQIEAWAKNYLNEIGSNYFREDQEGLLGGEAWSSVLENAVEGAKVGVWFHLLPGFTKLAIDSYSVSRAREFTEANKEVSKTVEASKTQQLSPSRMESFLRTQGLNQTVLIPAGAAWQMQQSGVDLANVFGWDVRDMEEAAALGHDIAVPLARLHAAPIQANDKNTLFEVMREKPSSMNFVEAVEGSVLADDIEAVNQAAEEYDYQQERLDIEADRIRTQITEAVRSAPELRRQLTTSMDPETSVSMYVDSVMQTLTSAARYLADRSGRDASDVLQQLYFSGLQRDPQTGYLVDPVEMQLLAEERAEAEADAPFWTNIWGRLDASSLKRDFPDARKELAAVHGSGLFARRKGEGVAIDELADELKTAGWLPDDADSSTLIEMLKVKKRPPMRRTRRPAALRHTEEPAPAVEPAGGPTSKDSGPSVADDVVGAPTLYQWQNIPQWKSDIAEWMRNDGRSEEEISEYISAIEGQMTIFNSLQDKDARTLGDMLSEQVVGAGLAARRRRNKGVAFSGPIRSNADEIYLISFDASSMCVKRLAAAKTAQMAEQMLGRPLKVDEQLTLIALYRAAGKEAPCIYCYVESNRNKARQAVGAARDRIIEGKVPTSWKKSRADLLKAAIAEAKANKLKLEDIHFEYVLDVNKEATAEADAARKAYPAIYDYLSFEKDATKQNAVKPYEEYVSQLLDLTPEQVDLLNGYAGIRVFSSSDFQVEHTVDLMQSFWDMHLLGAKSHAYTKVPLFVDIFGGTGQKINMSIFARENADGSLSMDSEQGWNWEQAKAYREKYPDVGTIMVCANDKILNWAMNQDWIDYCIPFHYSGLEKKYYQKLAWQDFTRTQVEYEIYPDPTPKGVTSAEMAGLDQFTTQEASVQYARLCFDRGYIPARADALFSDPDIQELTIGKRRAAGKQAWMDMVESGQFDETRINPEYFAIRRASASSKDKAINPQDVKRVRMHEMGTVDGISNREGTRNYLQICIDRKLYPVFPAFVFKKILDAKGNEVTFRVAENDKERKAQTKAAMEFWKRIVDNDGGLQDRVFGSDAGFDEFINPNFFKVKKDYARTDTPFNVVDPMGINIEAAQKPLRDTLEQGLDEKYKGDTKIAEDLVTMSRYAEEHGIPLGTTALAATRARKDPYSAVMGTDTRETAYTDSAQAVTLYQTAFHGSPYNFDRFTLDHIGAGEGGQAHGWGLYFALDKKTAAGYAKSTAKKGNGHLFKVEIPDDDVMLREGALFSEQPELVQDAVMELVRSIDPSRAEEIKAELAARIRLSRANAKLIDQLTTQRRDLMALADDLRMVAYEKEPQEDSRSIFSPRRRWERAMDSLLEKYSETDVERLKKERAFAASEIEKVNAKIAEVDAELEREEAARIAERDKKRQSVLAKSIEEIFRESIGDDIYTFLGIAYGGHRSASVALNEKGVKGIRYFSEFDGECAVVFDEKAINLLDRLYQQQETGVASQVYARAAGSTTTDSGNYFIQLFRGANLSTLSHEIMHAVHMEMERLDREGLGDDKLKGDLEALKAWTSRMDDDDNLKEEYEKYQKGMFGGKSFEDLSPEELFRSRYIAKEEMVARGFEQYLREGVAPTPKMEGLFRRFAKWLVRIYRAATQLDVELNDDVRAVFDRIIAAEEDIQAAAVANGIRSDSAKIMDALGLQGAERLELEGLVKEAEDAAADALRKEREKEIRARAKEWRVKADEAIAEDPVYRARKYMLANPIDIDSIVETYGKDLAKRFTEKLPFGAKTGGDNPELVAFDFGFKDAGEMLGAIISMPGVQERRSELVSQQRKDAEAKIAAADYLFEQEALAEREDRIGEALYRMEMTGRTQEGVPVPGRGAEMRRASRDQIRSRAEKLLDEKSVAEATSPDAYRAAASRAMNEERKAILAGDWATAIRANYKAKINLELARQAAKRRDLVEKLKRQAKRFVLSDIADKNARFGVFALAMQTTLFEPTTKMLANADGKSLENVQNFLDHMADYGLYTEDASIDQSLFQGPRLYYKYATWDAFRPYLEAMTVIMHMERAYRKERGAEAKKAWQDKMANLSASILEKRKTFKRSTFAKQNKIVTMLREFHASHLKADTICRLLDGDEDGGPVWSAIIAPINRATWDRAQHMKKERDKIKELFGVYSPSEWVDIRGKRYFVPVFGESITKEQALAVLLNCGNESNMRRLMSGNSLQPHHVQAIIDTLDERDVRFVQSVWDYLESFREESFDLEEELTGVRPRAIEAQPVQTRFGILRGGYYPVVYDKEQSSLPIDTESIGTLTGSMMPAVDHGSLKQRTAAGLGTPLQLDLEVVPRHVVKTVHMLAFRKPVQQVARVLNNRAVMGSIETAAGVEQGKALKSWLHYVAGERPASNGWSRTLGWLRKNSALYSMGLKLTTLLAQTTGLLASVAEIGPKWVLHGIVHTYATNNPFRVYRETIALSPMMENRMRSVDRDLYELSSGLMERGSANKLLDPFVRFKGWQERNAFLPMGFVQLVISDLPTWQGAYAKAMSEGMTQEQAVQYADGVVERTQVGGAEKDLAGVQRGNELGKIMTQFYSYFSALYQLYTRRVTMVRREKTPENVRRLATLFLLTGVLEPVLSALVTSDGPEDDEDWLLWGARKVFFNPWNMVVGVRDLAGAVEGYIEGYGGRARVGSLINDLIDTGVRFGTQIEKGMDMDPHKAFDYAWKLTGLGTGVVNAQELLVIDAFWNWLDGTNPEFELADIIRKQKK